MNTRTTTLPWAHRAPATELAVGLRRLVHARRFLTAHAGALSQTFFLNSTTAGVLLVGAVACAAPRLAAAGLTCSIAARLAAPWFSASQRITASGVLELNGWFLGLALATFFPSLWLLLPLALTGGALVTVSCIVLSRLLAPWELPLMVAPYLPVAWLTWAGLASFGAEIVPAPSPPLADLPWVLQTVDAGLRGVGQIVFLPDLGVGIAVAVAASVADSWLGLGLVLSSTLAVGLTRLLGAPLWFVQQGLAGFCAALVFAAARRRFEGIGWRAIATAVLLGGLLEAATLRIFGAAGLPALSTAYVALIWVLILLKPVRQDQTLAAAWSGAKAPRADGVSHGFESDGL